MYRKTLEELGDGETSKYRFETPTGKRYYRITLAPSTIPEAGIGAFAYDLLPQGIRIRYKGRVILPGEVNHSIYSWGLDEYDEEGRPIPGTDLCSIDATDPSRANWTRWANTGPRLRDNNIDSFQEYDQMYYVLNRDVLPGEELFVDYGPDYRHMLGIVYRGEEVEDRPRNRRTLEAIQNRQN